MESTLNMDIAEAGESARLARQSPALSWHALSPTQVVAHLKADPTDGLSDSDVLQRQAEVGLNSFEPAASPSRWSLLAHQFKDPLTGILLVAVFVSAAIGDLLDAAAIGIIVLINGLLGFAQEWRADRAIEALQAMLAPHARVIRNGQAVEIEAAALVPGDIVELKPGDQIPADLRLLRIANLLVDESALTGESHAVAKAVDAVAHDTAMAERSCLGYFGTYAIAGWGVGVVVGTGSNTEFGEIVELTKLAGDVAGVRQTSPLQKSLAVLGRRLGEAAVVLAALTVAIGVLVGRPPGEMFLVGVSLAVAIVPEGLPAVVTITLALGLRSMTRRKALLRHLEAAETLGAASVICTDKTGTLTENRMTVRKIWTSGGIKDVSATDRPEVTPVIRQLLETARQCNHASLVRDGDEYLAVGDPTESALLVLAQNLYDEPLAGSLVREIPFDSATKIMTMVVQSSGRLLEAHVKGAPEVVLTRCTHLDRDSGPVPLSTELRRDFLDAQNGMAAAGLRTLALAHRPLTSLEGCVDEDLTLIGLVGMHDPPRSEVPAAVAKAHSAGLLVVVMTGDAGGTALAIAQEIGLPATEILTGSELDDTSDDNLIQYLDGSHVLARVSPEHKMRVVERLQRDGAIVAMTGDGVNDAPALKQASIGVAMGKRGTDVARSASDLVLVDDNFSSIVAAIEEGRRQYSNIRKFIRYLLSSNLGEVIAVSGSVALGWPLILVPAQILWMNLMTDGVTALALGVEPVEPDAMEQPPRRVDESIVGKAGLWWILACGSAIGLITMLVFHLSLGAGEGEDLVRAQTLAFTAMVLLETANVFNFRAERVSFVAVGLFTNPWLLASAVAAIGAQAAAVYLPGLSDALGTSGLTLEEWLTLAGLSVPIVLAGELAKWLIRLKGPKAILPGPLEAMA